MKKGIIHLLFVLIFFNLASNVFTETNDTQENIVYFDGNTQNILIDSHITIESISFLEATLNSRIATYSSGWNMLKGIQIYLHQVPVIIKWK